MSTISLNMSPGTFLDFRTQIGNGHDPYARNILTAQQTRITSIALSIIGVIGFVYFSAVSFSTLNVMHVLAADSLLVTAVISNIYYNSIKDYENPEERAGYIQQIANQDLTEIIQNHTIENVIGYSLLGDVNPRVYAAFYEHANQNQNAFQNYRNQITFPSVIYSLTPIQWMLNSALGESAPQPYANLEESEQNYRQNCVEVNALFNIQRIIDSTFTPLRNLGINL
ncbi:MAG: hypothetical protein KAR79_04640 [Simkaniaceae bacterium]|nr:hypothetical protein [Simkaniaceae bacterium]